VALRFKKQQKLGDELGQWLYAIHAIFLTYLHSSRQPLK
jgi:hypothetical protein